MNDTGKVIDISSHKKEFQEISSADVSEIYPGFSIRLNQLIDLTDLEVPPLSDGRQSYLATILDASRIGPADWLKKDKPPRPAMLRKIVSFMLMHMQGSFNPLRVEAWLKYGDAAVGDPFAEPSTRFQPLTSLATTLVRSVAKELGIKAPSYDLQKCIDLTIETLTDFRLTDARDVRPEHRKVIALHIKHNTK